MSVVNIVRIDTHSGILVADEEFWRRGYRRTLYLDNLQSLLPKSFCEQSGMTAVIGLDGDPSITYEATSQAKKQLEKVIKDPESNGRKEAPKTLKDVVEITMEQINLAIRKRIDNQLKFAYGFNTNDLNRGYFESDGKKIEIKQEKVRTNALSWTKYSKDSPRTASLFEVHAIIAGTDTKNGFHWYEWDGETGNTMIGTGLFDSIGKGSDASSLAFIDIFRKLGLEQRRKGVTFEDALFALLESLEAASRFNHEVGGYPHFIILNSKGKKHADRLKEYSGHGAKLALEIVTASVHGFIEQQSAKSMLCSLILKDKDYNQVEAEFMKSTADKNAIEHFLRGYKNTVTTITKGAQK